MARSAKKGPYVDEKLMKKVTALAHDDKTVIKTWARSSEIAPDMIGRIFGVHNGKDFIQVRVTEEMVGHRLGEFSRPRSSSDTVVSWPRKRIARLRRRNNG